MVFRATGLAPEDFGISAHPLTDFVSTPDVFSFIVALLAGVAGVLTLTTAKSSALVGVLISVTTIPAAANVGVAAAYGDGGEMLGAAAQLLINLGAIFLAGISTLFLQRRAYRSRRRKHVAGRARSAPSRLDAGPTVGQEGAEGAAER